MDTNKVKRCGRGETFTILNASRVDECENVIICHTPIEFVKEAQRVMIARKKDQEEHGLVSASSTK